MTATADLCATEMLARFSSGDLSPVEALEACLARIEAINPAVNAVVALDVEKAREAARASERRHREHRPCGPLDGLPLLVKDTQETAGLRTTWGSPLFADHVPEHDQGSIARLRTAGAVIFGKTNTPEWAAGGNTRNPVHGATGNAFDPTRSAAGSSGGSAVALACGMAPLATGSDTGGSLRNPAAYAGIVGMRPSMGLVASEKRGLGWAGMSTDGPMGRTVADVALMLSVMASDDARDPLAYALPGEAVRAVPARWSPPRPVDFAGLRLAFTEDFGFAPTEKAIRRVLRRRAERIAPLFGRTGEAAPNCDGIDRAFAVLRAAMFLASFGKIHAERPHMLGPNVRANVEEGLGYTLADFAEAETLRTRIHRSWQSFFEDHDVLISPAVTISPRPWRELHPTEIDGAPTSSYYHWLALAYAATVPGHPALSLPLGLDEAGMPFGLQIVGPRGGDAVVLAVAAALEQAFADDRELARPRPDLARLSASPPIAAAPGFRDWD